VVVPVFFKRDRSGQRNSSSMSFRAAAGHKPETVHEGDETAMRMIFVNLPVNDLNASKGA